MSIDTMIQLDAEYAMGAINRKLAYQMASIRYQKEFEQAYASYLARRAADRKQWREITLPGIKREASLRAYERAMTEKN